MRGLGSRRSVAVLALAAALATGCDLVYPWSGGGGNPPAAPGGVRATLVSFDSVALSWEAQDGVVAYEVSGRVGAGSWAGSWASLGRTPGNTSRIDVQLDPSVPEAVDLGFRVRAFVRDSPSEWSAEAVVSRGIRPASAFTANFTLFPVHPGMPVQLTWQRGSTAATGLVLERRAMRGGLEVAPWGPLAGVGVADQSYVDPDTSTWIDGLRFEYRLRYLLGAIESVPVIAWTDAAPPASAVGLTASNDGSLAVHLAWTPVTQLPTARQVLTRTGTGDAAFEQEIATLDREAASYDDTVPAGGQYTYRIWTRAESYPGAPSAPATVITGIGPFLPSVVELPGDPVDRDAEGRFTLLSREWTSPLRVWSPGVSGWTEHVLGVNGSTWLARPYLRAPDGTPSLFYYGGYYSDPSRSWRDGGGWHSEALPFVPNDAVMDASGALHLVTCGVYVDLTYATNRSGAWVSEPVPHTGLPPPHGGLAEECAIAIGADGEPRIAYATTILPVSAALADAGLVVHGSSGWEVRPGPVSAFPHRPGVFRLFATAGGTTLFFAAGNALEMSAYDLGPDGWSAAVHVGRSGPAQFAVSPDGTRLAVTWGGYASDPGVVAVREAGGTWEAWSLPGYPEGLGVDASGKLWAATAWGPSGTYVVYTER